MQKYLDFKEAKCKNCYKCLKICPVKAIKIEDNQAKIIEDKCILCGKCTLVCPQDAKKVHSDVEMIKGLIQNNKVIATVAPSFISSFNLKTFSTMNETLKKLGFSFAEETARGAKIVVNEYEKILKTKKYKNFITSCCPAVNRMISLYYPNALEYLAPVDSPVIAHAKLLKQENPEAKVVFIGPCIAKKRECEESGVIDGVLTFEELLEWFQEQNIDLKEEEQIENPDWNKGRFFPISRGIIKAFDNLVDEYEYIAVDGTERCKAVLEEIDNLENVFLELNICQSSCINGPCSLNIKNSSITANAKVRKYVGENSNINKETNLNNSNIDINHSHKKLGYEEKTPTEEEIREVLAMTGKIKPEDELNCGACGYSTCREKAWAVINGYADLEMCLPYMREKAENMSYEIIKNSPNGIIVIDKEFKITDINTKARNLIGMSYYAKNESVLDYFDSNVEFITALTEKRNVYRKKFKISKTNSYVELSINYMKEQNMMFAIMKDITEEVNYNDKLDSVKLETIAMADEVIKKQMRVAQEIASLLGETTAETKVALVNLKKSLKDEDKKGE